MSNVHDILLPGIPGVGFEEGVSEDVTPKKRLEALDSVSVAVAVEVLNGTKFALVPVGVTANGGVIETEQMAVAPSVAEIFVARKHRTSPPFTGTHGTATWRIGEGAKYLTVGWSAPYNQTLFSNWLMIAVTTSSGEDAVGDDKALVGKGAFKELYYGKEKEWFQRKAYTRLSTTFCAKLRADSQFYVSATMDSTHKSVVSVTLLPEGECDLAPGVRDFVNRED